MLQDSLKAINPLEFLSPYQLITRKAAAAILGLTPGTLSLWPQRGNKNLPLVQFGSGAPGTTVMYLLAHVLEFKEKGKVTESLAPDYEVLKGLLLDRAQTAKLLGVKRRALDCWSQYKRYDLPIEKIGDHLVYRASDVVRFIESRLKMNPRDRKTKRSTTLGGDKQCKNNTGTL